MNSAISVDALKQSSTEQLLVLFATLGSPTIEEMNGEYPATLLAQPNVFASALGAVSVGNPLAPWQAKAFRPVDRATGRGYNTFRRSNQIVQRNPMLTQMAPSRYDQKPAYTLIYRAFNSICGRINMVDEIRRIREGFYLGIGTCGITDRQRHLPRPFLLQGPDRVYRGDIGTMNVGFVPGRKEIPSM
ncbi:hypothetical protein CH275_10090 [Rhodococcus sp. 06-235-1A]|uniref:hypothetical protein n=1 Tax=Rhodococcus sp. 06-235-1A TaxID=2022508 RepID=UPI000B9C2933|nr:hypothetical protein [Rhodococcus sp. 06-235-1A]OZD06557.1 hypothetical protein CH275_10090 [Rhodococcus sp. 06-235-1A]